MNDSSSSLVRPPALRPGDRVHIVSPAGPVTPQLLQEGMEVLRGWELDVVVDESVYRRRRRYDYLAGPDHIRHAALSRAWSDPACRAVICSRGGYGSMRLLPLLDLDELIDRPRLLVGFSDITALHLYLAGVGGLATLHGPVVKSLSTSNDECRQATQILRQALFATSPSPPPWTGLRTVQSGRAAGPVFGGNLSLIIPLLSTPYAPDLNGAILIIEEVGEDDYRLDRLLTALRLSEDTDIAGLVLGDFRDCDGVYVDADEVSDFVCELAADFDCPVVAGAPVGHGSQNAAFPVGVDAELDADAGTFHFRSHATRRPDTT